MNRYKPYLPLTKVDKLSYRGLHCLFASYRFRDCPAFYTPVRNKKEYEFRL